MASSRSWADSSRPRACCSRSPLDCIRRGRALPGPRATQCVAPTRQWECVVIKLRYLLLAAMIGLPGQAQAQMPTPRAEDVATIDAVMRTFYEVISGPAGQPRQWSRD